jgi:predicted ATP-dependent endonuclease of OLD family
MRELPIASGIALIQAPTMPHIQSFSLRNFKGAADVTIDISKRINSPVVTLIGLNESGKTTILEGLSYFVTGDNAVASLFGGTRSRAEITGLIPLHKKAAFTDTIKLSANVTLDDEDFKISSQMAVRHKLKLSKVSFPKSFMVSRDYEFEDSALKSRNNMWDFELRVSPIRGSKEREYRGPDDETKPNLWN